MLSNMERKNHQKSRNKMESVPQLLKRRRLFIIAVEEAYLAAEQRVMHGSTSGVLLYFQFSKEIAPPSKPRNTVVYPLLSLLHDGLQCVAQRIRFTKEHKPKACQPRLSGKTS